MLDCTKPKLLIQWSDGLQAGVTKSPLPARNRAFSLSPCTDLFQGWTSFLTCSWPFISTWDWSYKCVEPDLHSDLISSWSRQSKTGHQ